MGYQQAETEEQQEVGGAEQVQDDRVSSEQAAQQPIPEDIVFDIILASASPRRRQLLADAGVVFETREADVDETLEPDLLAQPTEAAKKLAERKAGAVVQEVLGQEGFVGSLIIIGADTMVVHEGRIFGKPHSFSEGKHMLRVLSGSTHQVHTAVSVWLVHAPNEEDVSLGYRTFVDTTDVTFKPLDDDEIDAYLREGESFDKAGAYGIQGKGARLVDHIDGSLSTVIGLPVERLLAEFPDIAARRA